MGWWPWGRWHPLGDGVLQGGPPELGLGCGTVTGWWHPRVVDPAWKVPPVWARAVAWWQGLVAPFTALGSSLSAGPGPFPAVIDLFGGAGGLIEFRAGLLASRGFAVLALAFFAYEDLPKGLTQLDLDYFEEAVELLLRHPKVSAVVRWAAPANGDAPMNEDV